MRTEGRGGHMRSISHFERSALDFYERLQDHHFNGVEALAALFDVMHADTGRYLELNLQERKTRNWFEPANVFTPAKAEAWEHHKEQHPVLRYAIDSRSGAARAISQFWSQRTFRNSPLYSDFYGPMGIEDTLCCAIA